MKSTYYLFQPGKLSRSGNTLRFDAETEEEAEPVNADSAETRKPKFIPIDSVEDLYVFGSLQGNSALFNFLGKAQVAVHFFDYYENYTGSFMPKEYLLSGKMQIEQTRLYLNYPKRVDLAKRIVSGAAKNILRNLKYYLNRDKDLEAEIHAIEDLHRKFDDCQRIEEVMAIEGNIRQVYYGAIDTIIHPWQMGKRTKQPPENEVNALISFGNSICYARCLSQIYHTQLNPTISFLHEPGMRRFSLALDIAEIFKPVIIDRLIFRMLNKKEISKNDFDEKLGGIFLKQGARKNFIAALDERLRETIHHRGLGRKVSYARLIRLECYKLARHILGIDEYIPFKTRW